jgi:hypothetical protein
MENGKLIMENEGIHMINAALSREKSILLLSFHLSPLSIEH